MANKKQIEEKCELCGEACSCNANKNKDKIIKVYVCPKCRSHNVGYIFSFRNAFGLVPRMRCKKCRYEAIAFPQLHISEKKLAKMDKKYKSRRKK